MLFEKSVIGAEKLSLAKAGKQVDIAMYDISGKELTLTAFSKDVISYRRYGSSYFDLAPYRLSSTEEGVGVRVSPGIGGTDTIEELYLFRVKGSVFQEVFARDMVDTEYYSGYEDLSSKLRRNSTLQIIPKASGMNDLKIVTRYYRFDDGGQEEKEIVKTTSEIWRWDENSQKYQLSR
jgi:hypothetical protein